MDCVSPILDIAACIWDCSAKRAVYIQELEKNLNSLRNEMVELKNRGEDVRRRVELAEQQQMMRRREVDGWLLNVEVIESEVSRVLQEGDREVQKRCLRSCPRNCWSSYKTGKMVRRKLDAVFKLKNKGSFDVVAYRVPCSLVDERPMEKTVGLDLTYERVCSCLKDGQVGIIGLYGMGGVGKTTLLKRINNEFLATSHDFDIVIWVVVSKPARIEKVQEVIRNKLQIQDDLWKNRTEDEKAAEIWKYLKTKKFVLLLDDIWERLDLLQVGVPLPNDQNMSKIVFTTRLENVCHQMRAQERIKLECLESTEALALFLKEVGEDTLNSHSDILKLAKVVAEECKGLPLALITIGRAMASMNGPLAWEQAIQELRKFPAEIIGMEDDLFYRLKFSYDSLRDEVLKSCFIYCSMFPEDYEIENDALIELWIGEGFLDEFEDIYEARDRGHKVIGNLKHACLLESGESEKRVKMHDVIRDMALWLACECGAEKKKFLVCQGAGSFEVQGVAKWKEAQRMSLWDSSFEEVMPKPLCFPNLLTLFLRNCVGLKAFPSGFFQFIPIVRVLDLSGTHQLTELSGGIDKLVTLQYLNLSRTNISELPIEMKNLKELRCLLMDVMYSLSIIPWQVISSFSSLQLLSMYKAYRFSVAMEGNVLSYGDKVLLEELESLEHLNDLSISLFTALSFYVLKSSHKLQRCIRRLCLDDCEDLTCFELSSSSIKRMAHLEKLEIWTCCQLEDMKINKEERHGFIPDDILDLKFNGYFPKLHHVIIVRCPRLLDLKWLIYAPSLQILYVEDCALMEDIMGNDSGVSEIDENLGIFSRLTSLNLINLPRLKSIYPQPLPFPSLEEINVVACLMLRSLPFDVNSATKSLKQIGGEQRWWARLQWGDETIEQAFNSYFTRIYISQ